MQTVAQTLGPTTCWVWRHSSRQSPNTYKRVDCLTYDKVGISFPPGRTNAYAKSMDTQINDEPAAAFQSSCVQRLKYSRRE
jgi:hypothetical protein